MPESASRAELVERICARADLSTYDPYDIWKTRLGFASKDFFNRHRALGLLPVAALTLFDTYVNNNLRLFYRPQEYPIVRALAALALLNLYPRNPAPRLLAAARAHLDWLLAHASPGYSGPCWGIGFRQPIQPGLYYEASLPLATMTPYALEAFVRYRETTGDDSDLPVIRGVHAFFDRDLQVLEETDEWLVTSYSPLRDRRVVNAVSYAMYGRALALPYLQPEEQAHSLAKIGKLYAYVRAAQRADGSWLYSPDGAPFIDCFHSCIVLKNVLRTDRLLQLPGAQAVVARGYAYVLDAFHDPHTGLFRRFSIENKPSLVRFDLYDSAELLSLATLLHDNGRARDVAAAIERHFVRGDDIYSQIDRFGVRYNRNTLRWAVMPYLHALSTLPA